MKMRGKLAIGKIAIVVILVVLVGASVAGYFLWLGMQKPPIETEVPYPEEVLEWAKKVKDKYEGKTVRIAAVAHPSTEAFRKLTPDFEVLTGMEVKWDVYEEITYFDKIMLIVTGEEVPYDLMYGCAEIVPGFAAEELFIPVDDYIANKELTPGWFGLEDIVPAYLNYMKANGKVYGIPFAGETIFVAYRKDLFEEYNKVPPKNYDELLELAKFFHEEVPDVAGVSIRCAKTWEAAWSWVSFTYGFGGKWVDLETMSAAFTMPETVASLEYFVELTKYGPPGMEAFSFEEAWSSLQMGKTAILVESTAAAPGIEDPEKSVVAGKVGYAKFPTGPAGESAGVWGWGLSVPTGAPSEMREATWALIVWLTSKLNADRYLEYGGIVTRISPLKKLAHPYDQAILDSLRAADSPLSHELVRVYTLPISFEMTGVVSELVSMAITGELTPADACSRMQDTVNSLLEEIR